MSGKTLGKGSWTRYWSWWWWFFESDLGDLGRFSWKNIRLWGNVWATEMVLRPVKRQENFIEYLQDVHKLTGFNPAVELLTCGDSSAVDSAMVSSLGLSCTWPSHGVPLRLIQERRAKGLLDSASCSGCSPDGANSGAHSGEGEGGHMATGHCLRWVSWVEMGLSENRGIPTNSNF